MAEQKVAAATASASETSQNGGISSPNFDDRTTEETASNSHVPAAAAAKTRLSKWASRLFEPDRPRGVIEPPRTIPLNDEFLQAFGKRERQFDKTRGLTLDVNEPIVDDDGDVIGDVTGEKVESDQEKEDAEGKRKVKITNIRYTTTFATLERACSRFGPLELTNLLMDGTDDSKNAGRAYVTFQDAASAELCVDGLKTIDDRPVNVTFAADLKKTPASRRGETRYWLPDLSTKCFKCGQVGHMADECPNQAEVKPCPLCAETDHDMRECPTKAVCFSCGIPGHVSRNCTLPRGPPRWICTVCYQEGHDKHRCWAHRQAGHEIAFVPRDAQRAVCMVCGSTGHYMCGELHWTDGLLGGVSCANCGYRGHVVQDCNRPRLDECCRKGNEGLVLNEVERASTYSVAEDLLRQQRERQRGRSPIQQQSRGRRTQREVPSQQRRFQSMPQRSTYGSLGRGRSGESSRQGNNNRGSSNGYRDGRDYSQSPQKQAGQKRKW